MAKNAAGFSSLANITKWFLICISALIIIVASTGVAMLITDNFSGLIGGNSFLSNMKEIWQSDAEFSNAIICRFGIIC